MRDESSSNSVFQMLHELLEEGALDEATYQRELRFLEAVQKMPKTPTKYRSTRDGADVFLTGGLVEEHLDEGRLSTKPTEDVCFADRLAEGQLVTETASLQEGVSSPVQGALDRWHTAGPAPESVVPTVDWDSPLLAPTVDCPETGSDAVSGSERYAPGHQLTSRYQVLAMLGAGGMGQVYLVSDRERERPIAAKCLHARANTPQSEKQMRREVAMNERLTHPHIVRTYTLDREESGRLFFTMEFVPGQSLAKWLSQDSQRTSFLEELRLLQQVATAVNYAHQQGVIHRDLKPGNVLVTPDACAKVMDFGIATEAHATTRQGAVGTAYYMAPEQLQGREISHAVDIYALGVIAFQCLTGQLPQLGMPGPSILQENLPSAVDAVIQRALHWRPTERFSSALEFFEALEDCFPHAILKESQAALRVTNQARDIEDVLRPSVRMALLGGGLEEEKLLFLCGEAQRMGMTEVRLRGMILQEMARAGLGTVLGALPWHRAVEPFRQTIQKARENRPLSAVRSGVETIEASSQAPFSSQVEGSAKHQNRADRSLDEGKSKKGRRQEEPTQNTKEHVVVEGSSVSSMGEVVVLEQKRADSLKRLLRRIDQKRPSWLASSFERTAPSYIASEEWSEHEGVFAHLPPLPRMHKSRVVLSREGKPLVEMMYVPKGSFWLGLEESEREGLREVSRYEKGGGLVEMNAFWIARTPLSNRAWSIFVEESGYQPPTKRSRSYLRHWRKECPAPGTEEFPVVWIGYEEAWAFCDFYGLSLPSETQWEKAARGDDQRLYPWGNQEPDGNRSNFNREKGGVVASGSYLYGSSPFGLLDCAGNVYEWCADGWQPRKPRSLETDPCLLALEGKRVSVRGGGYDSKAPSLRVTFRYGLAMQASAHCGFRPVLDLRRA